jgi:Zn-dependent protease with chaperone function
MSVLVALMLAGYVWGLPWLSQQAVQHIPEEIEAQIGDVVLEQINGLVSPSKLPAKDQAAIEQEWRRVVQGHTKLQQQRGIEVRPTRLLIRQSAIGPNALALPGGVIILTDDMVRLVRNDHQVIAGVLAHELGHVQHQHGMQMLFKVGVMGLTASLLWGDYSGVMAAVPLWLGQAHYSRKAELAADAYSVTVLRDVKVSPGVMVTLFERFKLYKQCGQAALEWPPATGSTPGPQCKLEGKPDVDVEKTLWRLGFASHPADDSRIAFFRKAAIEP